MGNVHGFLGCGGSNYRHHPIRDCIGLPDSVIDAIKEHGNRGVSFS